MKQNENCCSERNIQKSTLEYSFHNQDPSNVAVQEQWPNYTDKFSWYMGTMNENMEPIITLQHLLKFQTVKMIEFVCKIFLMQTAIMIPLHITINT
jgi:hypothetical protein